MLLLGLLVSVYAGLCLLAYTGQRRMLFPAPKTGEAPSMDDAVLTKVQAASGRTVYALWVPGKRGAVTVAHFHGNGEELAQLVPLAWAYRRAGLGFFAVEYPGYGMARDYQPSEETLYADSEAALWHLSNGLGVPPDQVVLQGQSLGSGVAVEMAKRGHGSRLVLLSPFTSVPDLAHELLPFLPTRLLIRDHFASIEKAPSLPLPVLVIHGTDDEVIPFAMGERLSKAFPNGTFYKVTGGHHNDLFVRDGRVIVDRIAEFARGEFGGR